MAKISYLNTPFKVKNLSLQNRIVMPPMCQLALCSLCLARDWWCRPNYFRDDQCCCKWSNITKLFGIME